MNSPTVSIIIPTYNHAPLLKEALLSVRAQTFTRWEAIVVNNFSDDETINVVESIHDSRIILINFRNFGVIAASRNKGLRHASGRYIAFLDSDDIWYPSKLQRCLDTAQSGYQFISHGELWVGENKKTRRVMYGPASRATYKRLLYWGNCISTSATFVEKSLIDIAGDFDQNPDIVTTEDYDLWIRISALKPKIIFIHEILGEFHLHSGSAGSAISRNLESELSVLKKHFAREPKTILNRILMRHRFAIAYCGAARQYAEQPMRSIGLFARAWLLSPLVIRIYPGFVLTLVRAIRARS